MKILVAVEESPYSHAVVTELTKRHWPQDTSFKLLTVIEPMDRQARSAMHGREIAQATLAESHRVAEQFCAQFRQQLLSGIAKSIVHFEVREGNVRDEIILAAAEWGADKIILGANTGLPTQSGCTGAVSHAVAHHASCSVEIIVPVALIAEKKEQSDFVLQ